ncbi:MarR family winged helix-turn-helix transcriptional regulator [Halalkalibacter urbisdiaboli]|uniref:MarR family winged helix-turn-helix transcriptional regulator n=1 Tax=Halalkalibacter urbisdiaboli TaxID=1960589 RepID=UPI000B44D5C2|nr:MarR family transcriptional regulator [Halalkalibacter urbisdiaboli]
MNETTLNLLIQQYEDTYVFATQRIEKIISEQIIPMTIEQFGILRKLHKDGSCRPKDLAEYTGVHKSAITQKSDRLVAKGYIKRKLDTKDRRNVYLSITKEGEAVYLESEKAMKMFIKSLLLKLDPMEIETLIRVHQKINTHMVNWKDEIKK